MQSTSSVLANRTTPQKETPMADASEQRRHYALRTRHLCGAAFDRASAPQTLAAEFMSAFLAAPGVQMATSAEATSWPPPTAILNPFRMAQPLGVNFPKDGADGEDGVPAPSKQGSVSPVVK